MSYILIYLIHIGLNHPKKKMSSFFLQKINIAPNPRILKGIIDRFLMAEFQSQSESSARWARCGARIHRTQSRQDEGRGIGSKIGCPVVVSECILGNRFWFLCPNTSSVFPATLYITKSFWLKFSSPFISGESYCFFESVSTSKETP
jgi:hypothetical protein